MFPKTLAVVTIPELPLPPIIVGLLDNNSFKYQSGLFVQWKM